MMSPPIVKLSRSLNPFEIRVSFELIKSWGYMENQGLNPFEIRVSFELLRLSKPSHSGLPREHFQLLAEDGELT